MGTGTVMLQLQQSSGRFEVKGTEERATIEATIFCQTFTNIVADGRWVSIFFRCIRQVTRDGSGAGLLLLLAGQPGASKDFISYSYAS
jgi:hypothetical protein